MIRVHLILCPRSVRVRPEMKAVWLARAEGCAAVAWFAASITISATGGAD